MSHRCEKTGLIDFPEKRAPPKVKRPQRARDCKTIGVILRFIPRTTPDYTHKMAGLSKHMDPSMQRGLSRTTNPTINE